MKKHLTLFSLTVLLLFTDISLSSAQKIDTIWFDNQWKPTSSVKARYYFRTIKKLKNKVFEVIDYYPSGKPQMQGVFSSLDPEVRNGPFLYYNEQGVLTNKNIIQNNIRMEAFTYNASGEVISHSTTPAFRTDQFWLSKNTDTKDDDAYPRYAEGNMALAQFFAKNIRWPVEARNKNIKGKVIVAITINEEGKIIGIRIDKGAHPLLDNEVLRVARLIPDNFLPAMSDGKPVTKDLRMPVSFSFGS